VLRRSNNY